MQFALFLVQTAPKVHYGIVQFALWVVQTAPKVEYDIFQKHIFSLKKKLFSKMSHIFLTNVNVHDFLKKQVGSTNRSISKYRRETIPTLVALQSHRMSEACPKHSTNRMRFWHELFAALWIFAALAQKPHSIARTCARPVQWKNEKLMESIWGYKSSSLDIGWSSGSTSGNALIISFFRSCWTSCGRKTRMRFDSGAFLSKINVDSKARFLAIKRATKSDAARA